MTDYHANGKFWFWSQCSKLSRSNSVSRAYKVLNDCSLFALVSWPGGLLCFNLWCKLLCSTFFSVDEIPGADQVTSGGGGVQTWIVDSRTRKFPHYRGRNLNRKKYFCLLTTDSIVVLYCIVLYCIVLYCIVM